MEMQRGRYNNEKESVHSEEDMIQLAAMASGDPRTTP